MCFEREPWFIKPRIGEPAIDFLAPPVGDVEGAEPVVTRSVVAQVTGCQGNTQRWDARARQSWSAGAPSVER